MKTQWSFSNALQKELYVYSGIYGKCYDLYQNDNSIYLDAAELHEVLTDEKELKLIKLLEQDMKDVTLKPWRFAGGVEESNMRFAVEYGKISQRIWFQGILSEPENALRIAFLSITESIKSPFFIYEADYEKEHMTRNIFVRFGGLIIGILGMVGISSSFVLGIASTFIMIRK